MKRNVDTTVKDKKKIANMEPRLDYELDQIMDNEERLVLW